MPTVNRKEKMSRNRLFENKLFFEQKGYFVELNQNKRKKVA